MLLIHGEADTLVPFSQSQHLYDQLKLAGAPVQIVSLKGLGHGFMGAKPKQLLDIIEQTFDFFNQLDAESTSTK